MIIKLNGDYTPEFLAAFKAAYCKDFETFMDFVTDNEITTDECLDILISIFGENKYIEQVVIRKIIDAYH